MVENSSPPPPTYSEAGFAQDVKSPANGCGTWLVQRTSIHIESTSIDEGSILRPSISPSISSDHSSSRFGRFKKPAAHHGHDSVHRGLPHTSISNQFGSSVVIEATRPLRSQAERRIELKGLEQAASAKRWTGGGHPGEPWGKLMKDPELWDDDGDTFIYFGYHRQDASFRIQSSLLEETGSDYLLGKLHEGLKQQINDSRPMSPSGSSIAPRNGSTSSFVSRQSHQTAREALGVPVKHHLYFPPSPQASRLDILRYHITTRNLLALLMNKALVGLTFYQALVDLQERLEDVLPQRKSAPTIIKYLTDNKLHDISNDPAAAAGLLAWSEDNFWLEGWREGFVHCNGTYSRLRVMPEYRDVSYPSRLHLENSILQLQNCIRETETRLSGFHFDDIWQSRKEGPTTIPYAFHAFRTFLIRHYEKTYKSWPPRKSHDSESWLNRSIVLQLQQDFGALYNYLVDHSATWNESQDRIIRHTDERESCGAKGGVHRLENMIVGFDARHRFSHIPKPLPLLPRIEDHSKVQVGKGFFGSRTRASDKRNLVALAAASNASLLGAEVHASPFIAAYLKFDKTDKNKEDDLLTVRKARWLLLYGVVQFLDCLAFITPHTCFSRNVDYFLNIKTSGLTPWKTSGEDVDEQAFGQPRAWLASPIS